jgi:hypothetical protein
MALAVVGIINWKLTLAFMFYAGIFITIRIGGLRLSRRRQA